MNVYCLTAWPLAIHFPTFNTYRLYAMRHFCLFSIIANIEFNDYEYNNKSKKEQKQQKQQQQQKLVREEVWH